MVTIDTIFEQYTQMRMRGTDLEKVYDELREIVVNNLTREERNTLSVQCDRWERNRTRPDLTHIQREALRRAQISNITLKITFCPSCDTPNAEGFTRCQVCDEPLAVEHIQAKDTTGIVNQKKGIPFKRDSGLILKSVNSNDRLVLQPQISPTGIKLGRNAEGVSSCDVDLGPFGGEDYGVSRVHAIIRFDRAGERLILIDNSSTNGTFINGVKIPPDMESLLANGDELKLARMVFQVRFK